MTTEEQLLELRGRVELLEGALCELLELQERPGLEAQHRASLERMREKGRAVAAANRRFLGGE